MAPNHLSILEKHALNVLDQLEYFMDTHTLEPEAESPVEYSAVFGDFDFLVLGDARRLHSVEVYLRANGLDFAVIFDLVNENLTSHLNNEMPEEEMIPIVTLRGENNGAIRRNIQAVRKSIEIPISGAQYNSIAKTLQLGGKEIPMSERAENYPANLLATLFKSPNRIWSNDEILEDWHGAKDVKSIIEAAKAKRIYHAGRKVNEKIHQIVGIKDFLIVNTKEVAIQKKYL